MAPLTSDSAAELIRDLRTGLNPNDYRVFSPRLSALALVARGLLCMMKAPFPRRVLDRAVWHFPCSIWHSASNLSLGSMPSYTGSDMKNVIITSGGALLTLSVVTRVAVPSWHMAAL